MASTTNGGLLPYTEHVAFEQCRSLLDDGELVDKMTMIAKDEHENELFVTVSRSFPNLCCSEIYIKLATRNVAYKKTDLNYVRCDDKWKTDDTLMELIEPMKIWRISLNGLLMDAEFSETTEPKSESHVRCNFLWHPISSPVFYDEKCSDVGFFVQNETDLTENVITNCYSGYEQWGMLHGKVYVNDQIDVELNMRCLRSRNWKINDESTRNFVIFGDDDSYFSVKSHQSSKSGHLRTLKKHVPLGNDQLQVFSDLKMAQVIIISEKDCKWQIRESTLRYKVDFNSLVINIVDYIVNDNERYPGYWISYKRSENDTSFIKPYLFPNDFNGTEELYTIDLSSDMCLNVNLVGGKASSLAKINFLKKTEAIPNFELIDVPSGFSITVHAMSKHLMKNGYLQERLEFLRNQLYSFYGSENDMLSFLERLNMQWKCSDIAEALKTEITRMLDPDKKYAIRSSGILEDKENFSFAGQNSTYLNVVGLDNVLDAVKLCWASIYSFQSIQYRRENGIDILQEMGVIVQEMVDDSEIAGVLFTCDPLTGDSRYMVLSYCFGLGEDIVSGRSLPNTLYYHKADKLLTKMKPFTTERNKHCGTISFERILYRLCGICQHFEQAFGSSSVDIEWAVSEEVIYILQCRPVTTIFSWSDFDIIHEIDSAFTEYDAITFHNCGEVMAGATSPLTLTFIDTLVEQSYPFGIKHPSGVYHKKLLSTVQFRIALNIFNSLLLDVREQIPFDQQIVDTAVCGRVITDDNLYQIARKRNGITRPRANLYRIYTILKLYNANERVVIKAGILESTFRIEVDKFENPHDLFRHISQQAFVLKKASEYHLVTSSVDNFLKVVTLRVMCDGNPDKLNDCIANMSSVLSQGKDTVSGEVPFSLQKISNLIVNESIANEFSNVDPSAGYDWLKNHSTKAFEALTEFLDRHGCRGIKEFDLISETWAMKPEMIIETLQFLIKAEINSPVNRKSVDMNARSLNTVQPTGHIVKRKMINWLLSRCQNAVAYREQTKRSLVVIINEFRMAFRKLSQLMFRRNMLPDPNLIFLLTYHELYRIIEFDEKHLILNKVMKRRRLWDYIENLDFPHVIIGLPKPINKQDVVQVNGSDQVRGFAVTSNSAKGRACLLENVAQANQLHRGDILITKSIDIGWSPYFPMLGGIVTELGGFVSHGAVIAREYGLPCVVSVPDATKIFRTGDVIAIVGSNGTVQKIPVQLENEDVLNKGDK